LKNCKPRLSVGYGYHCVATLLLEYVQMAKAKDKEKLLAKELYMQTSKTIDEISTIVSVNRLTVGGWAKEGNWKAIKEAQKQTPERVVQSMYAELDQINEFIKKQKEGLRFPDAAIANSRNLIILGIKRMQQQIALPQYVAVLSKFLEHIQRLDLELSKKLAPIANDFLNDVAEASTKQD